MKIKFNSSWVEVENQNHLSVFLEKLSLQEKKGIAVAVNDKVIPRKEWSAWLLNDNDEVIIIEASQGG